jgi:hypothetical protein
MAMSKLRGLKREKIARGWKQVHTVELQEFIPPTPLPKISKITKSKE